MKVLRLCEDLEMLVQGREMEYYQLSLNRNCSVLFYFFFLSLFAIYLSLILRLVFPNWKGFLSIVFNFSWYDCEILERKQGVLREMVDFEPGRFSLWPWNENARTRQEQQTNGNRAIWLVIERIQTRVAFGWWSERSRNRYFLWTSYCNAIGQSNNAFSISGFSLAGKRRVHVLIFSSTVW